MIFSFIVFCFLFIGIEYFWFELSHAKLISFGRNKLSKSNLE